MPLLRNVQHGQCFRLNNGSTLWVMVRPDNNDGGCEVRPVMFQVDGQWNLYTCPETTTANPEAIVTLCDLSPIDRK